MRRNLLLSTLLGAAFALPNCGASMEAPTGGGEAAIGVTGQAVSTSDVARIAMTVTGPAIPAPIRYSLTKTKGLWSGTIGQIPAGADRTFHADVFDTSDVAIFVGEATGVTIGNQQTATVVMVLQQQAAPKPFKNTAPVIDSATASASSVVPAAPVALNVVAHDVDVGDSISFAWTASGGSFDHATSSHPIWTAPSVEGRYALTATVSDTHGATRSVTLNVDVAYASGKGSADVSTTFNDWPVVANVAASPGRVDVRGATLLTATASDPDGDPLAYAWTDGGCGGTFSSASAQSPTWTAPAIAPSSGTCSLVASVTDGRGGANTGALVVQVGPAAKVGLPPVLGASMQSAASVDPRDTVVFHVAATDPEGQALTFGWSASGGALAVATTSPNASEIVWTAPATGGTFTVTATVTDAAGQASSQSFAVSVNGPVCGVGLANCNALPGDGCEVFTKGDPNNCGACGTVCALGQTCSGGACVGESLVIGDMHACALRSNGSVSCWGLNTLGQLGDGSTYTRTSPVTVNGPSNVVQITSGRTHVCELLSNATVLCWGDNANGQLGNGTTTRTSFPTPVTGLTGVRLIAAGDQHTCAIMSDGTARCWGVNMGTLGDGTTTTRLTPVVVSGVSNVAQLTLGVTQTCARLADGTARCWGSNQYGELGDGTMAAHITVPPAENLAKLSAIGEKVGHGARPLFRASSSWFPSAAGARARAA